MTFLRNVVSNIWRGIEEHQRRRIHYWQLMNLSDKELADIGLNRYEIHSRVNGRKK